MINGWSPVNLTPTIGEQMHGISASNPFGDLSLEGSSKPALHGWSALQTSVGQTLVERLLQSQRHRSHAWSALARAR